MKIAAMLGAATLIATLAGCTQPSPSAGPTLGCYDDPTDAPYGTWDIRLTAPLGTVGNAEMLYGSFDGTCSGDIIYTYTGTLVQGHNGAAACDEAVGRSGWVEELDLSPFTSPASLVGYWICLPART